ncbi:MAG TPA: TetR family transcriptional regulator [Pseudonocardiaceae bacterium]|jgi:AcrR family transcriptional regulator
MTAELADRHQDPSVRRGRRRSTSRVELEQVAFDLFADKGFEETTVDEIAAAAGISRRTFFRYYESKNDVVLDDAMASLAAGFRDVA